MKDKEKFIQLYNSLADQVNELRDFLNEKNISISSKEEILKIKINIQKFLAFLDELIQKIEIKQDK